MLPKLNCILIVDRDPISNYLEAYACLKANMAEQVLVAHTAIEALDLLENFEKVHNCYPQLILADIDLPELSKLEFTYVSHKRKHLHANCFLLALATTMPFDFDLNKTLYKKIVLKPLKSYQARMLGEEFSSYFLRSEKADSGNRKDTELHIT